MARKPIPVMLNDVLIKQAAGDFQAHQCALTNRMDVIERDQRDRSRYVPNGCILLFGSHINLPPQLINFSRRHQLGWIDLAHCILRFQDRLPQTINRDWWFIKDASCTAGRAFQCAQQVAGAIDSGFSSMICWLFSR